MRMMGDTTADVSLVVVNWNGAEYLRQYLPSVVEAAARVPVACEVLVVDNASTDDSVAVVRQQFPSVRLVQRPTNEGFIGGNNAGAAAARGRIVVFLNNDVEVEPDFLAPLLPHFEQPDVFAVGCKMLVKEGIRKESGWTRGWVRFGLPVVEHNREEFAVPLATLYACGAAMAVDRQKFLELGGFHPIFQPFYWEDTDLSYRAWQRGWRVLFEPRSTVYHLHRGSIGRLPKRFIATVLERNRLLFVWSNWRDRTLLLRHLAWLPWYLLKGVLTLNLPRLAGLFGAIRRLPQAMTKRRTMMPWIRRSDTEILRMADPFAYQARYYPRPRLVHEPLRILMLCPYLPIDGIHGGAVRMFRVIEYLARRHVVDIVSFLTREEEPYVSRLRHICHQIVTVSRRIPWQPDYLGLASTMVDEFNSVSMHQVVGRQLLEQEYDVLQCEYLLMSQYAPTASRCVKVLTEHEVHFLSRARDIAYASWQRRLWATAATLKGLATETALCERFDALVTVSASDRHALQRWLPRVRVETIPSGTDPRFFQPDPQAMLRWDLVFLGYFRHHPNVDAVLWCAREIWPRIRKTIPTATWVIVGYDPPPEVAALQAQPGITVTGYVEDVRPYLAQSRVFVMPIRLGCGLRMKLAEAWAMALPVVTTPIGCEGYRVTHGQDVLIADHPRAFAKAIIELLSDPTEARRIGAAGRRRAEREFDWNRVGRHVEALYWEVLMVQGRQRRSERFLEVAEADRPELVPLNA